VTIENTAISRRRPPELIPGYKLSTLVGKGGMGEVHKAVQLSLGRTVAVKLLAAELAQDQSFVTRFEKEAAALATLSHPHIVAIVDKGKADKTYYLVMEFVDGPSLREVMRSPSFEMAEALKLAFDVCKAIDYAHGRGVIHRDLKPENILIDAQAGGIPKVSDFGLASFMENGPSKFHLTETHVSMGTQAYMAPEQRVDAKSADHRADVFSLGVILYELLVGELPVGHFDPPSQRRSGVDPRLDAIVERCLKPAPAERYQKVSELLAALLPLIPATLSHAPKKATRLERIKRSIQRALRTTTRVAEIAVVLVALGFLGMGWLRSRSPPKVVSLAAALAPELEPEATATFTARVSQGEDGRRVHLGAGPDRLSVMVAGRTVTESGGHLTFAPPSSKGTVGRALIDLTDQDGDQVDLEAQVSAAPAKLGAWGRLRAWALGHHSRPRTALILQGTPGRYAAVILDGNGPARLTWAFGERRGEMTGPTTTGRTKVELEVDRDGELRAFLSSGPDRRQLAEPISLGKGWRKFFGKAPTPEIACLEGACEVSGLQYVLHRDPPPAPPADPPPEVAKVVTPRKPVHSATVKRAPVRTKKPAPHPAPKRRSPRHR